MKSRKAKTEIIALERAAEIDWQALYEAHADSLFAFLRRTTGDVSTAEDLLQDTFVRAIGAGARMPIDAARPWLFRVAANLATSHLRRRRLFSFLPLLAEQPGTDGAFDVEAAHVRYALRSIPAEHAVALTLALHNGFSRREIASMLGVSEETIKSRLARGRRNFAAAYRRIDQGLAR